MDVLYVLAAGLILLIALAVGEASHPVGPKLPEAFPPLRSDHSPEICRFPDAD